jgi:hypothetical protein
LHAGDTIEPWRLRLKKSMPVESRALRRFSNLVMNRDLNGIAPVGLDRRPRKLVINQEYGLLISIWGYNPPLDCEVITSDDPSGGR